MRMYVRLGLLVAVVLALGVLAGRGTPAHAWTYPAALNTNAATDSGADEWAQVTTDGGGNWVAVWYSSEDLFDPNLGANIATDCDILVARSTDNGASWTPPAALNTNAATDSGGDDWPELTTDGGGHWLAVWQSWDTLGGTIGTDKDILVARSTDNGATWTYPEPLNTNAATDSAADWLPRVTTDGGGHWVAVWESTEDLDGIDTDMDILVSRSTNDGASWTDPAALNTNAATDSGRDLGPQVTTDDAGHWVAVWNSNEPNVGGGIGTDKDILVARSTDNGATWTAPAALNTNASTDSGNDRYPQVATDGGGKWVTTWHSDETNVGGGIGTDWDILVARSTDNGATWTAPAALNSNAAADSGEDALPQVTTDGGANWVVVWHSTEPNVGSGIGTDEDILYATDYIPPYPPVGGIAELPEVSDSAARNYVALAGLAGAALVALGAGGWYARRRWLG